MLKLNNKLSKPSKIYNDILRAFFLGSIIDVDYNKYADDKVTISISASLTNSSLLIISIFILMNP